MWDLVLFAVLFVAAAVVYRFRAPILARLVRFDARNAARRAEEFHERRDRFAHYRRAVLTAEESLEPVAEVSVADARTGERLKRFQFLGEHYLTRSEAEAARRTRAIAIAREFYAELDGRSLAGEPPPPRPVPLMELAPPASNSGLSAEALAKAEAAGEQETTPPRPS